MRLSDNLLVLAVIVFVVVISHVSGYLIAHHRLYRLARLEQRVFADAAKEAQARLRAGLPP